MKNKSIRFFVVVMMLCIAALAMGLYGCQPAEEKQQTEIRKLETFSTPEKITAGKGSNFVLPRYFAIDNYGLKHYADILVYDSAYAEVEINNGKILISDEIGAEYTVIYTVTFEIETQTSETLLEVVNDSFPPIFSVTSPVIAISEGTEFDIKQYISLRDDSGIEPVIEYSAQFNGEPTEFGGERFVPSVGKYIIKMRAVDYSGNYSDYISITVNVRHKALVADFEVKEDINGNGIYTYGNKGVGFSIDGGFAPPQRSTEVKRSGEYSLRIENMRNLSDFSFIITGPDGKTNGASLYPMYSMGAFWVYYEPVDDSEEITLSYGSRVHWRDTHLRELNEISFFVDGVKVESGALDGTSIVTIPTRQWVQVYFEVYEYYNASMFLKPYGYDNYNFVCYIDDYYLGVKSDTVGETVTARLKSGEQSVVIDLLQYDVLLLNYNLYHGNWQKAGYEVVNIDGDKETAVNIINNTVNLAAGEYRIYFVNKDGVRAGEYKSLTVVDSLFDSVDFGVDVTDRTKVMYGVVDRPYEIYAPVSLNGAAVSSKVIFNAAEIPKTGNSFIPVKAGNYILRYTATKDGRSAQFNIKIKVLPAKQYNTIKSNYVAVFKPVTAFCGQEILLPAINYYGGYGSIYSYATVQRGLGEEVVVSNGRFTPDGLGIYTVRYYARDRVSTVCESTQIKVTYSNKAVVSKYPNFPYAFVSGTANKLSKPEARLLSDSGSYDAKILMEWEYNGKKNSIGADGIFTPVVSANGDKIKINFVSGADTVDSVEIPVIIPKKDAKQINAANYFISDGAEVESDATSLTVSGSDSGAGVKFANILQANQFEMRFRIPAKGGSFGRLNITLTDAFDSSVSVRFGISPHPLKENSAYLYINNQAPVIISGSFVNSKEFILRYSGMLRSVIDGSALIIGYVNTDAEGDPFTGFGSNSVKMRIDFDNIAAGKTAKAEILSLNQQKIMDTEDLLSPAIVTGENVRAVAKGSKIVVAAGGAYDVFDPYVKLYVTVLAPGSTSKKPIYAKYDGRDILESEAFGQEFTAELSGVYRITYNTVDNMGNTVSTRVNVNSSDMNKLAINISEQVPTNAKTGKSIKIPEAALSNGVAGEIYVYVIGPDASYTEVKAGEKYVFTKVGVHRIVYYAITDTGLSGSEYFSVTVS